MKSRFFAVFCLRSAESAAPPRFGFTVPRALGNAVTRNRIKRRMREAVRLQSTQLVAGWTIVFNPRHSVITAGFQELCGEVSRVFAECSQS